MPVLLLALLIAADIDGTWTRAVGRQVQTLTLHADGEKLTGKLEAPGGRVEPLEIEDGKIEGDKVTFKVIRDAGEKGKLEVTYTGTVTPTELKLTMVTEGTVGAEKANVPPAEQVFSKAK